jgi:RcsF protein
LRKYYACFTGLFVSTHVKRLFYAKQISRRACSKHRNPAGQIGAGKTESDASGAGKNLYRCDRIGGKPFRELGEVTGESCQASNQDSPPNIPTARKRMQINAAK